MLDRLRQATSAVALLICVALLATWLTGAHAHWHVGGHEHEQALHAGMGLDSDRAHGHNHEQDFSPVIGPDFSSSGHSASEHFDSHLASLIHEDGHENIELHALQRAPGKTLPDIPLLVLLCCAVLALTLTRTSVLAVITDPPDPKRSVWSLRPPLRGPPSFSVV